MVRAAASGPLRLDAKLLERINAILPVQTCAQKYSAFPVGQINSTSCPSWSDRAALANVINVERDAVDAGGAQDESANLRTAKSCGPDASTPASSLARRRAR